MANRDSWNRTETLIYEFYQRGVFKKEGMRNACEQIAEKLGDSTPASIRGVFSRMKRYGAFPTEKKPWVQISFRMSPELHEELREVCHEKRTSINYFITQAVKSRIKRLN